MNKINLLIINIIAVAILISVSFTSVVGVSDIKDKSNYQTYIDSDIHLTRIHLPILKRSIRGIRNSENSEYEVFLQKIISTIEVKGEVNSIDVENIVNNLGLDIIGIHSFCSIYADCDSGFAIPFPLTVLWKLTGYLVILGIGGLLLWQTQNLNEGDSNEVTLGSDTYTDMHRGFALGYFGLGHVLMPREEWQTSYLDLDGFVILALVIPY